MVGLFSCMFEPLVPKHLNMAICPPRDYLSVVAAPMHEPVASSASQSLVPFDEASGEAVTVKIRTSLGVDVSLQCRTTGEGLCRRCDRDAVTVEMRKSPPPMVAAARGLL